MRTQIDKLAALLTVFGAFTTNIPAQSAVPNGHQPHSIVSKTVVTSPKNRARTKLGIGEDVTLIFTPSHKATWTISGPGKINGDTKPVKGMISVTFTAPDKPTENDKPSKITATCEGADGGDADISFTAIKPEGVAMIKVKDTFADKSLPSIGMRCEVYITPADVNFSKVKVKEEGEQTPIIDQPPPVNGVSVKSYFDYAKGIVHRPSAGYASLTSHEEGKGTKMNGNDNPQMTASGPTFKPGFYLYKIPWAYKINSVEVSSFVVVEQKGELIQSGNGYKFVVTKAGAQAEISNP